MKLSLVHARTTACGRMLRQLPQLQANEVRRLTSFWTWPKYESKRTSENLSHEPEVSNPSSLLRTLLSSNSRVAIPTLVVAVPNVVDPDPHREQRVLARPRGRRGFVRRLAEELVHLVDQREDRRLVRRDERRVNRRAAIRVVVSQDERLVVHRRVDVDPVRTPDGGVAGIGRVAERVAWDRDGVSDGEAGLGVGVAAAKVREHFPGRYRGEYGFSQAEPEVCVFNTARHAGWRGCRGRRRRRRCTSRGSGEALAIVY